MRVLIFGDSITQGFYDTHGGWANRLINDYLIKEIKNINDTPTLFNLGISGDTTKNVLNRFDAEADARLDKNDNNALVFAIGTNDTIFRRTEFDSTPEMFFQQLTELLEKARRYTSKILFVGLSPVIDNLLQPFPWSSSGKCYSTERMKIFDSQLEIFCKENQIRFVSIWDAFNENKDLGSLFFDGIHPNDLGHEIIYKLVSTELTKLVSLKV